MEAEDVQRGRRLRLGLCHQVGLHAQVPATNDPRGLLLRQKKFGMFDFFRFRQSCNLERVHQEDLERDAFRRQDLQEISLNEAQDHPGDLGTLCSKLDHRQRVPRPNLWYHHFAG